MVVELQIYKGWTIDNRLRQFRRVIFENDQYEIDFIDFKSEKGRKLIEEIKEGSK